MLLQALGIANLALSTCVYHAFIDMLNAIGVYWSHWWLHSFALERGYARLTSHCKHWCLESWQHGCVESSRPLCLSNPNFLQVLLAPLKKQEKVIDLAQRRHGWQNMVSQHDKIIYWIIISVLGHNIRLCQVINLSVLYWVSCTTIANIFKIHWGCMAQLY